ncbi:MULTISPECIES: bifunctional metallophosphatase/5'-nucleotidase [Deefgea]|uniref:Bifunctional metallophosphatase/5'-nucleotidase n=1 Tax=Deefgea chitinilytica TaxID=570276 RepID=A0ABS2CFL0_9NEIS|nr:MULTISPECIES: bifunctional metallophosphatase/5'-nucleotidase [Deefgea]MBM5572943.1 bifunctional metallophosphatase/5'-nucleotidase [Deefgea chitinilytica]MBM9890179.1 bifunctional metallophosphatase/5'-nucleotidase [Deefgea sp. CFH1-16]
MKGHTSLLAICATPLLLAACGGGFSTVSVPVAPSKPDAVPTSKPSTTTPAPVVNNTPIDIKLLAINDFHGNLKSGGSVTIPDPADTTKTIKVAAGGSEYLATWLKTLKAKNPNHIVVSAGDLIGASPLLSALFHDEPTIEAMNEMGLELNAVGNHEFDEGSTELMRMQNGGCHPTDGCKAGTTFGGAKFKFLAANVVDNKTGKTIFPEYHIKEFGGVKVAFIGMTLKNTPAIVTPAGVAGLTFKDEADTVNALVPKLKAQGIESIIVIVHEGGTQLGNLNECKGVSGEIVDIVKRLDTAVDAVVSGHTHQAYNCQINGKLVTSANQYGRMISEIDLTLDPQTRDVIKSSAKNIVVSNDVAKDSAQTAIISKYDALVKPLENRVVGTLAGSLLKATNPAGESTLGNVIADAQLAATSGATVGAAQIAFMNPGGVRADLIPVAGQVTYGQLFTTQPFGNTLVSMMLTGAQIKELLEQQFVGYTNNQPSNRILLVSNGFSYSWDSTLPAGQKVDTANIKLNGVALSSVMNYRVTMNNYLASGGDLFTVLTKGTNILGGAQDVDALEAYIKANANLAVPTLNRVVKIK